MNPDGPVVFMRTASPKKIAVAYPAAMRYGGLELNAKLGGPEATPHLRNPKKPAVFAIVDLSSSVRAHATPNRISLWFRMEAL